MLYEIVISAVFGEEKAVASVFGHRDNQNLVHVLFFELSSIYKNILRRALF